MYGLIREKVHLHDIESSYPYRWHLTSFNQVVLCVSVKFCTYFWVFLYFWGIFILFLAIGIHLGLCIHLFSNRILLVSKNALMVQFIIIYRWWICFWEIGGNPYTSTMPNLLSLLSQVGVFIFFTFIVVWLTIKNCR